MEYVLDVSKWRCGSTGLHSMLGKGATRMLNEEGYMCCLGQFASQKGVPDEVLFKRGYPAAVAEIFGNYDDNIITSEGYHYIHTQLANDLYEINDDPLLSTPQERVSLIRDELEKNGHTLKVINDCFLY